MGLYYLKSVLFPERGMVLFEEDIRERFDEPGRHMMVLYFKDNLEYWEAIIKKKKRSLAFRTCNDSEDRHMTGQRRLL